MDGNATGVGGFFALLATSQMAGIVAPAGC
jgi:hypothetical protein